MGSWKETCMMSNLPINLGDDVAVFVLRPVYNITKEGRLCYHDDRYSPLGFPIKAKYNDYGYAEDFSNEDMHEAIFKKYQFFESHINHLTGSQEYTVYEWKSLTAFLRDVSRGDLYMETLSKKHKVTLAFVHLDLCDRLIENMSQRTPFEQTETYSTLLALRVARALGRYKFLKSNEMFTSNIFPNLLHLDESKYRHLNEIAQLYFDTADIRFLHGIMNYLVWHQVMTLSRKGYYMNSGCGGDEEEYLIPAIIAEFVMEKCEQHKQAVLLDEPDANVGTLLEETLYWFD